MSVIMPPMLLAKAKGIKKRDGFIFMLMAILTTIGSNMATVPVLLTKAPIADVTSITSKNSFVSLFPASFISLELIILASPVWNMAPPTTNSPTIIITTLFEKPERASSGVRIPKTNRATKAHSATISERTLPFTKNMTVSRSIVNVMYMNLFFNIIDDKNRQQQKQRNTKSTRWHAIVANVCKITKNKLQFKAKRVTAYR